MRRFQTKTREETENTHKTLLDICKRNEGLALSTEDIEDILLVIVELQIRRSMMGDGGSRTLNRKDSNEVLARAIAATIGTIVKD